MPNIPVMNSPGVYITEVDLSQYTAVRSSSKIFGIVGTAQNGPINEVTSISTVTEFENIFGLPIGYGGIAAVNYLNYASTLLFVRTAGDDAEPRSVVLPGKTAENSAVVDALTISYKYDGTLFNDTLTATVAPVSEGSADQFVLTITRGSDNVLLSNTYSILSTSPNFIGNDDSTDFVFDVNTEQAVASLDAVPVINFTAGNNGADPEDDAVIESLNLFNNTETLDVDVIAAPGFSTGNVVNRLVTIGNTRKDALVIIDPPQGLSVEEVCDFANGTNSTYEIQKLDSTYAAIWYPWGKCYNTATASNEWVPPSVGVIAAMGQEYITYDVWTAPAGQPRFNLSVFSEMERVLDQDDRDELYTNNINPLCNYKGLGLTALGQKTTQRTLTATNRINVRFLVNYVKNIAEYSTIPYLFSNIDDNTFSSWTQDISKQLDNIRNRGGLYDYLVTMDSTTVTPEMLNNNIMPGVIQIKPTKSAEFIPIDVVIRNYEDEFDYIS